MRERKKGSLRGVEREHLREQARVRLKESERKLEMELGLEFEMVPKRAIAKAVGMGI